MTRRARLPLVLLLGAVLAGCSGYSGLGYYWQAAAGHVRLMRDARPVAEVMADPATPAPLKQKLELTQRIRRYASDELGLPDNSSYTRYADLHRPAALVVPSVALKVALGEFASDILGSQRALPRVLEASGFAFEHPDLESAARWVAAG